MADYIPITATSGNLKGICPICNRYIHRRVSLSKIDQVKGNLDVMIPQAQLRITESASPSVSCDFGQEDQT